LLKRRNLGRGKMDGNYKAKGRPADAEEGRLGCVFWMPRKGGGGGSIYIKTGRDE